MRPTNVSCNIPNLAKKRKAKQIVCIIQHPRAQGAFDTQLKLWTSNAEELDQPPQFHFPIFKPYNHSKKRNDVGFIRCDFAWVFWNGKGKPVQELISRLLSLGKRVVIWPC
jgi:hypothetical protein